MGFPKYFLLYYYVNHKCFIYHYLNWVIIQNITKNPKNSYFIQFYYHILFKTQEYLCLAIFEKLMIQVHGKTILSIEFKSMIKAHDLNPWQFIYPKPNFISNIKAQFSLAISKVQLTLALFKPQFSLATSKPNSQWQYQKPNLHWHYLKSNFHWQHQSPILIGNIKSPTYVDTI